LCNHFLSLAWAQSATTVRSPLCTPPGRSSAPRCEGGEGGGGGGGGGENLRDLQRKVDMLEGEVEELNRSLSATREELQFVQRLLEKPKRQPNA